MIQLIVPVKSFRRAKTRLSAAFSGAMRADLARALARNLLTELSQSALELRLAVVTSEPEMAEHCADFGTEFLWESGEAGLNGALRAAEEQLGCRDRTTAIICADLPLFRAGEFDRILRRHLNLGEDQVTIVPDLAGEGTNLRLVSAPCGLPYLYGTGSAGAHVRAAKERGLAVSLLQSERIGLDIDTPDHVQRAMKQAGASVSTARSGIGRIRTILSNGLSKEAQSWK